MSTLIHLLRNGAGNIAYFANRDQRVVRGIKPVATNYFKGYEIDGIRDERPALKGDEVAP